MTGLPAETPEEQDMARLKYQEFAPALSQDGAPAFRASLEVFNIALLNRMVRTRLPEGLVLIYRRPYDTSVRGA